VVGYTAEGRRGKREREREREREKDPLIYSRISKWDGLSL